MIDGVLQDTAVISLYLCHMAQVKTQKWNANLLEGLRVKSFKAVSIEIRQPRHCCVFDTKSMLITFALL